ncbi:ABC transporter transmembrane domain-containing protein, partial [Curtobacterium flaccumfaciens]|nr:ABC transporter transmembrane domain-containing protein [Curtobacterium flaccumfaciens]
MKPLDPRLLRLSRTARGFIVAAAGTGVLRTLATIAIAWGIAAAVTLGVDAVGDGRVPAAFGQALALLGGAFVLRAVAAWATDDLAARAAAKVKSEMRTTVLARAAERGPSWLAGRSSAGFATTLGPGLDALDAYFGRYLPQLALTAIATPMLLVAIGLGDLTSGLIILFALPVIPVFMILIGLATQSLQRKQSDALAKLGGAFTEAVEGLATLKVFGRARRQVGRIGAVTDEYRRGTIGVLRLSFVSGFALELAASLSVALVAVSIGIRLVDGSLGLGAAMFVLVLAPEAFAPIRQVGADFHAAQDGVEASAAVLDVLADDDGDAPAPG